MLGNIIILMVYVDTADNSIERVYDLLQKVIQQNTEISADVKVIKDTVQTQNVAITNLQIKVETLEKENEKLKQKLEVTERTIKENNLIIFGLPENGQENLEQTFKDLASTKLGIPILEGDISAIFRIGKQNGTNPRPVVVKLVRSQTKICILKNAKRLKGTGIFIQKDLTAEQQKEQKILIKHYKIAKERKQNVKILKNRLLINGDEYSAEQLEAGEDEILEQIQDQQSEGHEESADAGEKRD
nr:unnamed protein product [Callosobruchus analis]